MLIGLDKDIREFIDTLEKQNRVLDNLLQLEEAKRQLIILGQVEELNKLVQKQGIIVSNLEKLEDARFKSQLKLARRWEITVEELPASMILTKVKEARHESSGELQAAIEKLDHSLSRLKAANDENNGLVKQSLDYINTLQSLLTGDVAGTYSDRGTQVNESTTRPKLRIIDKKA